MRNLDVAVDIVTVQEAGLGGMDDQDLLEIAAASGQILISHDRNSMTAAAAERLQSGHEIAGLVLVPQHAIRSVIAETIVMIGNCSDADEWVNTVDYLPWPAQNHER